MASIFYIECLSQTDLRLLTQLLANYLPDQPLSQWLQEQETQIATLPSQLLRPKSLLLRLALRFPLRPMNAVLCPVHNPLSTQLIHRLFLQVTAEATIRLIRFFTSAELEQHPVTPVVAAFIRRMQVVNSLWMAPEIYAAAFSNQADFSSSRRFKRVESGCEACILACVGADKQLLTDLRTGMLGRRMKSNRTNAVLWDVVEAWIGQTGEGDEIREVSDRIGKKVRVFRRVLQLAKRGARLPEKYRTGETGLKVVQTADTEAEEADKEEKGGDEEYDFENEIIDYYRNLISTSTLALPLPSPSLSNHTRTNLGPSPQTMPSINIVETSIHPSFRASLSFCTTTETLKSRRLISILERPATSAPPSSPPPLPPCQNHGQKAPMRFWDTESIDSGFCSETASSSANLAQTADERAHCYRRLVGISSDSENLGNTVENLRGGDKVMSGETRVSGDGNAGSEWRSTNWSSFYKGSGDLDLGKEL